MTRRFITPQDISNGNFALTNLSAADPVCFAFFRNTSCNTDAVSTGASGSSTSPQASAITTTLAGDMDIMLFAINGNTGQTYAPARGYSNADFAAP